MNKFLIFVPIFRLAAQAFRNAAICFGVALRFFARFFVTRFFEVRFLLTRFFEPRRFATRLPRRLLVFLRRFFRVAISVLLGFGQEHLRTSR